MVVDRLEKLEKYAFIESFVAKAMEYTEGYRLERSGIRKVNYRVMIW